MPKGCRHQRRFRAFDMFYPLAVSENGLEDVGWDTVTSNYGRDKDLWMTSVAGSF